MGSILDRWLRWGERLRVVTRLRGKQADPNSFARKRPKPGNEGAAQESWNTGFSHPIGGIEERHQALVCSNLLPRIVSTQYLKYLSFETSKLISEVKME